MSYADLISRLRCPEDRAELDNIADRVLVCKTCGRAYPIHEGIPVMLLDERVQTEGKRLVDEAKREGLLGAPAVAAKDEGVEEPAAAAVPDPEPAADATAEADGGS